MTRLSFAIPFLVFLAILPYPGTVALRLLALACAFVFAVSMLRKAGPAPWPIPWAFAFWTAVSLVSLSYAVDPVYSLGEIKNEVGYSMMAFFSFLMISFDRRATVSVAVAAIASLAFASAWVLAVMVVIGAWPQGGGHGGAGTFATHLTWIGPCLVVVFALSDRTALRGAVLVASSLVVVAALVSQQRVIWVVLSAQIAVGLLLWGRYARPLADRARIWLLSLLVIMVGVAAGIAAHVMKYGEHAFGEFSLGRDPRVTQWPLVVDRILDHWASGAGFGRNAMKLAHPDLIPPDATYFWHAHNVLLNHGLAAGIPGIVALLLLIGGLLTRFASLTNAHTREVRLLGCAGAMLVTGLLVRNFTNDFFLRDGALAFWALAGLIYGHASREAARK